MMTGGIECSRSDVVYLRWNLNFLFKPIESDVLALGSVQIPFLKAIFY